MTTLLRPIMLGLSLCTLAASPVWAQSTGGGGQTCAQIKGFKNQQQHEINAYKADDCRTGTPSDPPPDFLLQEGKAPQGPSGPGMSGFSYGTIQPPETPPGAKGAPDSVSAGTRDFSMRFPPWAGFPCSLPGGINICGGGSGSGSSSSGGNTGNCPTSNDDNETIFGVKQPVTATAATLDCGGAVPLTTYQMSLTAGADSLLITEYGHYEYWLYRKIGGTYQQISPDGAMLPNRPCGATIAPPDSRMPPVSQMISFNSSAGQVVLSLIPAGSDPAGSSSGNSNGGDNGGGTPPPAKAADPLDPSDPLNPNMYLVLPVNAGASPPIPDGCNGDAYFRPSSAFGDIVFETVMVGGCEAGAEACSGKGSETPSVLADCQLDTTYPDTTSSGGGSSGAPVNACADRIQMALLDRPNLMLPPKASVSATPIEGMTSMMVATVNGSAVKDKVGHIVHLGSSGKSFTLPEGGLLGLNDGNRLWMNGPATVSASGSVTLTRGGTLQTNQGTLITTYPNNTTLNPNAVMPVVFKMNESVAMPAGYTAPTSPNAKVRLPVVVK